MIPLNPYIAGNPVGGGEAFIGRADVLREVLRMLARPNENALLLYGQRRIGKTSVLQELRERLPTEGSYHPVYFDLQDQASVPVGQLLRSLARCMGQELGLDVPELDEANTEVAFQETFLPEVLSRFPEESKLVLLLDEFDVLDNPSEGKSSEQFFPYLRHLLNQYLQRLQFVFVIGRRPEDLTNITNSVFKGIRSYPVSLLTEEDTGKLVRLSEKNESLSWTDDAVGQVYALTGGHPFLTQQLCQEVWEARYEDDPDDVPTVEAEQVGMSVAATLKGARQALEWLWSGLAPAERIVAAALAEAGPDVISQEILEQHLRDSGIRILIGELQNAPRILEDWDLIAVKDKGFHFCVELLRKWVVERKPLSRVQEEIDRIQPMAENLYQAAKNAYSSNAPEKAILWLRQSTRSNPNHVRANQLLAEILITQGALEEARNILEDLYKYQPIAAKQRLVQVITTQAAMTSDREQCLSLYERALSIDSEHEDVRKVYQKIWMDRGNEILLDVENNNYEQSLIIEKLNNALDAFSKSDAKKSIEEIKSRIKYSKIESKVREIESYLSREEYERALEFVQDLHRNYPECKDDLPNLDVLRWKVTLKRKYSAVMRFLQKGDVKSAKRNLVDIVSIDPDYKDSLYYLLQIVKSSELEIAFYEQGLLSKPIDEAPLNLLEIIKRINLSIKMLQDEIEELEVKYHLKCYECIMEREKRHAIGRQLKKIDRSNPRTVALVVFLSFLTTSILIFVILYLSAGG